MYKHHYLEGISYSELFLNFFIFCATTLQMNINIPMNIKYEYKLWGPTA